MSYVHTGRAAFGAAPATVTATRAGRNCSITERRFSSIVEPTTGELVQIDPRHLQVPTDVKYAERRAYHAYQMMKAAAEADGIHPDHLKITSGYRSVEHQKRLWAKALARYGSEAEARKWVARPGGSPHHTGRAFDLTLGVKNDSSNVAALKQTPGYAWLVCNAGRFGFFPYAREPWHWEFNPAGATDASGVPLAPPTPSSVPTPRPAPGGWTLPSFVTPALQVFRAPVDTVVNAIRGLVGVGSADKNALAAAMTRGVRDASALTDAVFYARHPELNGRRLTPGDRQLVAEWINIRETVVKPALQQAHAR